jgi:hypothetical protein
VVLISTACELYEVVMEAETAKFPIVSSRLLAHSGTAIVKFSMGIE